MSMIGEKCDARSGGMYYPFTKETNRYGVHNRLRIEGPYELESSHSGNFYDLILTRCIASYINTIIVGQQSVDVKTEKELADVTVNCVIIGSDSNKQTNYYPTIHSLQDLRHDAELYADYPISYEELARMSCVYQTVDAKKTAYDHFCPSEDGAADDSGICY
jgi:hypothetical protein